MKDSDKLSDFELIYMLKRMLINKNKKSIDKQKAIYKITKKKLINELTKENESN